jgi:hypothetical protein
MVELAFLPYSFPVASLQRPTYYSPCHLPRPRADKTEGFYREYSGAVMPVMDDHQELSTYDRMTSTKLRYPLQFAWIGGLCTEGYGKGECYLTTGF